MIHAFDLAKKNTNKNFPENHRVCLEMHTQGGQKEEGRGHGDR